jgi:hypothetical protein
LYRIKLKGRYEIRASKMRINEMRPSEIRAVRFEEAKNRYEGKETQR